MKIVSPYRPYAPYISNHIDLGFDWQAALWMLKSSVDRVAPCPFFALTDEQSDLPVPSHRYPTREPKLMIWLIEAWHAYVTSVDFDQDTVMLSPDMLVCRPLDHVWKEPFDLGLVVRTERKFFSKRPLLNGIHFWRHAAKAQLGEFFAKALDLVRTFEPELVRWGGDAESVWRLVAPIKASDRMVSRNGVSVGILPATKLLRSISSTEMEQAERRTTLPRPDVPVLDFRYRRKASMRPVFDALKWPRAVSA